jgi:coenzyme F420-0:L-glutamate ligase/coenzyme F420-1:gamma-L-glutamate ligase
MKIIPICLKGDVHANSNLASLILSSIERTNYHLKNNDVLVVAHKIVSKAEGRVIDLVTIRPSKHAISIAKKHRKDPRIVELILRESRRIVKMERAIMITETKHGFVCANAGIDKSNVSGDRVVLLPINPDRSAVKIKRAVKRQTGKNIAVIISDTFGRPFRQGQVNVAIGIAGLNPLKDYRGTKDMFGKQLKVTEIAIADEIASAAELVMGKTDSVPVVIITDFKYDNKHGSAKTLIRKRKYDLFR